MQKAIRLARDLGIRTIQIAGYDVYYEPRNQATTDYFAEGLSWAVDIAAASQVMVAVEIMDTEFMNSITKVEKLGITDGFPLVRCLPGCRQSECLGQ